MSKNIFHVLAVDDDDRIRELVKQFLEENNFLVTTAKNAFEARKKLEIVKFDILILDIMMPGESGLSLTKLVKKNNPTPIILLTAKGDTKDRIEGLESGNNKGKNCISYQRYIYMNGTNEEYKIVRIINEDGEYPVNYVVVLDILSQTGS